MKRLAIATALVVASCGSSTTPAPLETAGPPYRDLPEIPRRKIPVELPEQYIIDLPPRPKKARASRTRPSSPRQPAGGDVWAALSRCESNGPADRRNPRYRGAFQFSWATWQSVGESGDPADHSYETQLAAAQRLQARSGWGQWPRCARKLGLL